ncbi:hypothetical protein [Streptomyces sp. NPDC047043]|uniref:hypothetical protein n=1 Tax=Streptomyces sp. NPDC047043 TaxID=3154497 RepID=UPI00340997E4
MDAPSVTRCSPSARRSPTPREWCRRWTAAALQPLTEKAGKPSGGDSIAVFSADGIRCTHPGPNRIGKHLIADDPYREESR